VDRHGEQQRALLSYSFVIGLPVDMLNPTFSHYLIANGVALLAISQHPKFGNVTTATKGLPRYAGALIGTGAVLFSGSIFLLLLDRAK
jgi:uncharacterized membrane protein YgdD (TMEM256/DUF423 family)